MRNDECAQFTSGGRGCRDYGPKSRWKLVLRPQRVKMEVQALTTETRRAQRPNQAARSHPNCESGFWFILCVLRVSVVNQLLRHGLGINCRIAISCKHLNQILPRVSQARQTRTTQSQGDSLCRSSLGLHTQPSKAPQGSGYH